MKRFIPVIVILVMLASLMPIIAAPAGADSWAYTTDADFDQGSLNNVVHDPSDQLQLSDETEPFNFIWVAVSSRGTAVKIDTETGQVLGEYWTSPNGSGSNPSRTTVDKDGNVWVGNRNLNPGSVIHIAAIPTDKNGDGTITTSTGLGNVLPWGTDEAVIHYVTVNATGTRHVSVNADNDVWVSGTGNRVWDLIDGDTGAIIRSEPSVGYGGYGGLIDGNGVIWSARNLLWWDTSKPITDPSTKKYGHDSYGLGIDSQGNVWNTSLGGNAIHKFAPDGSLLGTYGHGTWYAQGCVADQNDHIWVASSLYDSYVSHILNNGTFVGNILLDAGAGPTGVAVDANGYIWATGYNNGTVYRIDPNAGPVVGGVNVGAVDMRVQVGGRLYNYSDMTGSTLYGAPESGSWTVVKDSGITDAKWGMISWTENTPGDSSITVSVAGSTDGVNFGSFQTVANGADITAADGQYLKIQAVFSRSTAGESPILYDLTVNASPPNEPPVADAGPDQTVEQTALAGTDVTLDGSGSTDDGELQPLAYTWTWAGGSASGVSPTVSLPLGTKTITLTVDDGQFTDSDEVVIEVEDTTAPTLSVPADVTVEQATADGTVVELTATATDICDADVAIESDKLAIYPLGTTTVTFTATDDSGNSTSGSSTVTVVDTTGPVFESLDCVETVNPHGNNVPGKNRDKNGKGDKKNVNPDGFYEINFEVTDVCDADPMVFVGTPDNPLLFGITSGIKVKFTESVDAVPEMKKIGSPPKGGATAITWHIILPTDPVITVVDFTGNQTSCTTCLVPPPPM